MTTPTHGALIRSLATLLIALAPATLCPAAQDLPDSVVSVHGTLGPARWRPADDEVVATLLPKAYADADDAKAYVAAEAVQTWWRGARNAGTARRNALGNCRDSGGEDCELIARGDDFEADFDDWFVAKTDYLDLDTDREYVVTGDPAAPLTMVTYLSYTCPECAKFFLALHERLRRDYVSTGRLRWVIRDFPRNDLDVEAGLALRCFPPERFFELVGVFYARRDAWKSGTDALVGFAASLGADRTELLACMADESRRALIVASRYEGARMFNVGQTPAMALNGLVFHGLRPTEDVLRAIDHTLAAR